MHESVHRLFVPPTHVEKKSVKDTRNYLHCVRWKANDLTWKDNRLYMVGNFSTSKQKQTDDKSQRDPQDGKVDQEVPWTT
jgi:hypothetical protein